ncbi:division/cell wall cluster transcriptional repressor MraZ [Treponema parvum]|uniref:Transcriptional regulator MraZ n=1 Tax=Treponema parvum TaxID=138851 RepID=A0A975IEC0_9SPIR|nr:division/cell wall cluster transcriptional repressor MraZ [Treponema parvum]QTQ13723.1 division/cell wall cluster transcriptional repressor MraZ [Treponema parvum]
MSLLTGEYRNTLDEKGRILFPAKLRSELSDTFLIVTQGIDACLWLYTPAEWDVFSSKIMESASPFNEKNRSVIRRIIAPAQEVEFDKAGRLSIPQTLRDFASLSKDCLILGNIKYFELWDAESYGRYLKQSEESFRDAAEELNNITF